MNAEVLCACAHCGLPVSYKDAAGACGTRAEGTMQHPGCLRMAVRLTALENKVAKAVVELGQGLPERIKSANGADYSPGPTIVAVGSYEDLAEYEQPGDEETPQG